MSSWSRSKLAGVSQIWSGTIVLAHEPRVTPRTVDSLIFDLLDPLRDADVGHVLDGQVLEHGLDARRLAGSVGLALDVRGTYFRHPVTRTFNLLPSSPA